MAHAFVSYGYVLGKAARPEFGPPATGHDGGQGMIKLTRIDGQAFILNAEMIRFIDSRPDTFITLNTGERVVVREDLDRVVELSLDYHRKKSWLPQPHLVAKTAESPATQPRYSGALIS